MAGGMTVSAVPRLPTRSYAAPTTLGVRELRLPATGVPPLGRPSFPNDTYRRLPLSFVRDFAEEKGVF